MNTSFSAIAAVSLATILGIGGAVYSNMHQQLEQVKNDLSNAQTSMEIIRSEREDLKKQVEDLEKKLNTSQREIDRAKTDIIARQTTITSYRGQVKTLSTCLQGIVVGMNELSQGDNAAALLTFSSISANCREAGSIIEQQNSTTTLQGESLPVRSAL